MNEKKKSSTEILVNVKTTPKKIKGGPGSITGWFINNPNSEVVYVLVFDKSGDVTLGNDRPKVVMPLPAGAAANALDGEIAIDFENECYVAAVITDPLGNAAPAAGINGTIFYN